MASGPIQSPRILQKWESYAGSGSFGKPQMGASKSAFLFFAVSERITRSMPLACLSFRYLKYPQYNPRRYPPAKETWKPKDCCLQRALFGVAGSGKPNPKPLIGEASGPKPTHP